MLEKDPAKRITSEEAFQHPFLKGEDDDHENI